MPKDTKLYDLLNVSPSASDTEIRKAYYKLAKIHHPDKSTEATEEAEEKFKEIKFAYEVLNDKNKRDVYDKYGLEGLKDDVGGTEFEDIFSHLFGGAGGFGGGAGASPFGFPFDIFGGGGGGMGGMGGMGGRTRQAKRRTQNVAYPLKVTLEDLYNGTTKEIDFDRQCLCKKCDGKGGKEGATKPCTKCSGRGFVMQYKQLGPGMVQQMQAICRDCSGEGETINDKDKCKECDGKKTVKQKKALEVPVERGMSDGQKITFRGISNEEPGAETGDLIVVLQQEEHKTFKRSHEDLFMNYKVNITEALCGFKIVVKHLDGRQLVLDSPPGTILAPDTIKGIEKEGMPIHKNPYEKGNLYIKFTVEFPDNLSTDAVQKLEKLLPARKQVDIPKGDNVEEVSMMDYENTKGSSRSGHEGRRHHGATYMSEAFGGGGDDDDDDDDEGGPAGGQRVDCNTH